MSDPVSIEYVRVYTVSYYHVDVLAASRSYATIEEACAVAAGLLRTQRDVRLAPQEITRERWEHKRWEAETYPL